MSYKSGYTSLVLLAALSATACQPLPQPFQPGAYKKLGNPLHDSELGGGIAVRPVAGLRGGAGQRLAEKIAAALLKRDFIALRAPVTAAVKFCLALQPPARIQTASARLKSDGILEAIRMKPLKQRC